jgi:alkylation response protein AidB-like acyl-CoA dehydrogenase
MQLNEEQISIRTAANKFAQTVLAPNAALWEENAECPPEAIQGLADLGFLGMLIPSKWGGTEAGHVINAIVMEEIAAGCGGVSTIMHVHNFGGCVPIVACGSEEQKARFLPDMASGAAIGAFCLTEPHAGSDSSALKTRAVRDGDHYVINGTKQYITNGKRAAVAIVIAVTDPAAGKNGITAFIVPTNTPGFIIGRTEKKMGQNCSDTVQVFLENCRVPAANVLGAEGNGYRQTMALLSDGRVSIAAQAVGLARAAFDASLAYARQRHSYGKPIIEHQAVAFRLAEMSAQIDIARQYMLHAASLLDSGQRGIREAASAKMFAAEMAERVCSEAIQIHGGNGYIVDYAVERIFRDVRICQIYEGTGDMQRLIISRLLDA